jgi:hypothetical protein
MWEQQIQLQKLVVLRGVLEDGQSPEGPYKRTVFSSWIKESYLANTPTHLN